MRFQNKTANKLIREACIFAHYQFDYDSKMLKEIREKNDFKYSSGTGEEIYERFLRTDKVVNVFTYRPWNPFSRAIGMWDGKAVHINVYKLKLMLLSDVVANLCHEYCHAVGYGHGNNYKTKEKCLYSVPYFVSEGIQSGRWS